MTLMCGRYTLSTPPEVVATLFDLAEVPAYPPRFNLAPTQQAPVVRVTEPGGARRLDLLRWGLVPYWAKEAAIGNRMINARSEGVAEKPAYRSSFRKKRCLVVTDGFFEWQKQGKGPKQPYLIRRCDRQPFAFAGLWSSWKDPERGDRGGEPLETFTILTTSPNEAIRPLHDRMPVILASGDFDLWLDPKVEAADRLLPLLTASPAEDLELVPVSRAVNSPAYDGPQCIEPLLGPEDDRAADKAPTLF
jgi:putative SOS response-associated peptidase YedK